jgi:hypothetical protein
VISTNKVANANTAQPTWRDLAASKALLLTLPQARRHASLALLRDS